MNLNPTCPVCNAGTEMIVHSLRDCAMAKSFLNTFNPPINPNLFYSTNVLDWLRFNSQCTRKCGVSEVDWGIIFPMAVRSLWLRRNNIVFGRTGQSSDLQDQSLARAAEVAYLGLSEKQSSGRTRIQVKWLPPPLNWFKLNSDGSSMGNPGLAGGGGIIRDSVGRWVKGYARAIGVTTSVAAELWALRDGIRLCISLNLPAMEIELDAKVVADFMRSNNSRANSSDVIIADCIEDLKKIPLVRILHYFREANKCVDALARRGALLPQDFMIFMNPPPEVVMLLSLDAVGTLYDRFIPSSFEAF